MKKLLLAALLLYCSAAHSEAYFQADEGRITLSTAVCCDGNQELMAFLKRANGEVRLISWDFRGGVYHIYLDDRHLIFHPDDVKYEREPGDPDWIFDDEQSHDSDPLFS